MAKKKKDVSQELGLNDQTPREIVAELDKYIVGQDEAKKSVAIALRNRWRSHKLPDEMRDDVIPKNILMIGSTGVGKRLAHRQNFAAIGSVAFGCGQGYDFAFVGQRRSHRT